MRIKTLGEIADALPESAWKPLVRSNTQSKVERAKRPNVKEQIVVANGYENQRLEAESYAEFDYQPVACGQAYRMVVVRKDIKVTSGQQHLFDKERYFFYITNESAKEVSCSRGDSRWQPTLRSREHDQPSESLWRTGSAAGHPGEQLGLHGIRFVGLDAESVERDVGSRQRQSGSAACACATARHESFGWNSRPS